MYLNLYWKTHHQFLCRPSWSKGPKLRTGTVYTKTLEQSKEIRSQRCIHFTLITILDGVLQYFFWLTQLHKFREHWCRRELILDDKMKKHTHTLRRVYVRDGNRLQSPGIYQHYTLLVYKYRYFRPWIFL